MHNKIMLLAWLMLTLCMANAQQLLVLGIDGLNTKDLQEVATPNIDRLMQMGSYSLTAHATIPTSSNQNWSSMFKGASPNIHKMFPEKYVEDPSCEGYQRYFPSVFTELQGTYPDIDIVAYHHWRGFKKLFVEGSLDKRRWMWLPKHIVKKGVKQITKKEADLVFMHVDYCDHAGHKYGHGSAEYEEAIARADKHVGIIMDMLEDAGMLEEVYILLTLDHGGTGFGHGGTSIAELQIPWIMTGPTIKKNHPIQMQIVTYDTAATIAELFGIAQHSCWMGKPVSEIFTTNAKQLTED